MAKKILGPGGEFVGYDRSGESTRPRRISPMNRRSVSQISDLALDGRGYYFGHEHGASRIYFQSGTPDPTFPLEVRVSVVDIVGGVKAWVTLVPDLGVSFSIPYWDSEGRPYGLSMLIDR